ncbi:hypothetical protein NDU88_004910 [Pleurodeles waltl]|uniref:Uncharacterized protein n=1 Tax=Pleurodeles waltl TaxID=8319 RepID=A0AAV7MUS8_PLEWA|nr:hypothetical protein NDU88_004910 [Pleurodeles waltl]
MLAHMRAEAMKRGKDWLCAKMAEKSDDDQMPGGTDKTTMLMTGEGSGTPPRHKEKIKGKKQKEDQQRKQPRDRRVLNDLPHHQRRANHQRAAVHKHQPREHGESAMAGRENVMQVQCSDLQEQVTGSEYSELHKTRPCRLKPAEESGFYMKELGGGDKP